MEIRSHCPLHNFRRLVSKQGPVCIVPRNLPWNDDEQGDAQAQQAGNDVTVRDQPEAVHTSVAHVISQSLPEIAHEAAIQHVEKVHHRGDNVCLHESLHVVDDSIKQTAGDGIEILEGFLDVLLGTLDERVELGEGAFPSASIHGAPVQAGVGPGSTRLHHVAREARSRIIRAVDDVGAHEQLCRLELLLDVLEEGNRGITSRLEKLHRQVVVASTASVGWARSAHGRVHVVAQGRYIAALHGESIHGHGGHARNGLAAQIPEILTQGHVGARDAVHQIGLEGARGALDIVHHRLVG
mmetsp:Transcript_40640/g.96902  ORF Transcript_40640/g.96902 Transcript_40640/m.96902 type:complete len:297 (+) Transcript_40640:116-1006(+)